MSQPWRKHVTGDVAIGPVHINCDGRRPGSHADRRLATWWCDDDGWHVYGGRSRRGDVVRDGKTRCSSCGLDVTQSVPSWQSFADRVAAGGVTTVPLRAAARIVSQRA